MPARFKTPKLTARLLAACCFVLITLSGYTSAKAISFIRDTEIENTIRLFSAPIFEAAGLNIADIQIHIVNDPALNAFVAAGQRLFINTGLLMRAEHAGQVIGVIAHEAGHISGGHLIRLHENLRGSTAKAVLTTLFGGVAAHYTRSMEQAADQAAVNFLDEAGYSGKGLAEFLGTLSKEEALLTGSQDIYLRSHPLTRDRIKFMNDHVATSTLSDKPLPTDVQEAHDRMRAKLKGFINPPSRTLREYKADDPSFSARYARAIAYKLLHQIDTSLALIDGLIAEHPNDPFLYELKGDVLQDAGRVAESIPPYNKALEFLPWAALIRVNLAQSQLEAKDPALGNAALENLLQAVRYEPEMPLLWRLLATAYARGGDQANVMLALAEEALLTGKNSEAKQRAARALEMLPEGSAGARRAQDIQNAAKNE
ncbi:MAG: M48 family metalloprotease [Alphaproteobacteria bacterium]|nr:M48 family metalloprotease [Alphaproteobacteria bacterium]